MTQEEKAKAYDKALATAKRVISNNYSKVEKLCLECIFPELKESEDERIRKWLLECVENLSNGNFIEVSKQDVLSYLEKQKEQEEIPLMNGNADLYFDNWIQHNDTTKRGCFEEGIRYAERLQKEQKLEVKDPFDDEQFRRGYESGYADAKREQKPAEPSSSNNESEYDRGYRDGKAFQLKQVEQYSIGKTFMGLIPCWVNAPSTRQPAHKYHGKNAVIMHENNGGFMCCFIDDEEATVAHLPENTGFVEGWRKKPAEWSNEDKAMIKSILFVLESYVSQSESASSPSLITTYPTYYKEIDWLKSLRPSWKPSEEQMDALRASNSYWKGTTNEVPRTDLLESLYNDLEKLIAKR